MAGHGLQHTVLQSNPLGSPGASPAVAAGGAAAAGGLDGPASGRAAAPAAVLPRGAPGLGLIRGTSSVEAAAERLAHVASLLMASEHNRKSCIPLTPGAGVGAVVHLVASGSGEAVACRVVHGATAAVIVLSCAMFCLGSVDCGGDGTRCEQLPYWRPVEVGCIVYFTAEYLARVGR